MMLDLEARVEDDAPRFAGTRMRGLRAVEGDALCERWLAVDGRGRAITLLRLREEHARDRAVRDAWLEQAARNRALDEPALLPLLDHGLHAGRACASLARADDALPLSMLLAHLAARRESPSLALALHVVDALAAGLYVAHARRGAGGSVPLVHGDLCCERVLVRADGRVQMAELGLWSALPAALGVKLRSLRGAVEHLPPERAGGAPADVRGDVYALGVLLRRMMGGAACVRGETRMRVSPGARELAVLLGGMLAVSPDARIAEVDALRRRLAALPRHEAGHAALAQLHADVRVDTASPPSPRRRTGSATALFVGLREPPSQARTRPWPLPRAAVEPRPSACRIEAPVAVMQPPLVDEPAPARVTPAPALSPRLVARGDPESSLGTYLEPSETLFEESTRARAVAQRASDVTLPTRIAMTLAALLLLAALCLLSALIA